MFGARAPYDQKLTWRTPEVLDERIDGMVRATVLEHRLIAALTIAAMLLATLVLGRLAFDPGPDLAGAGRPTYTAMPAQQPTSWQGSTR